MPFSIRPPLQLGILQQSPLLLLIKAHTSDNGSECPCTAQLTSSHFSHTSSQKQWPSPHFSVFHKFPLDFLLHSRSHINTLLWLLFTLQSSAPPGKSCPTLLQFGALPHALFTFVPQSFLLVAVTYFWEWLLNMSPALDYKLMRVATIFLFEQHYVFPWCLVSTPNILLNGWIINQSWGGVLLGGLALVSALTHWGSSENLSLPWPYVTNIYPFYNCPVVGWILKFFLF